MTIEEEKSAPEPSSHTEPPEFPRNVFAKQRTHLANARTLLTALGGLGEKD
jgi:hypothetical protein